MTMSRGGWAKVGWNEKGALRSDRGTNGTVRADAYVMDILKADVTYIARFLSLPTLLASANRRPAVDIFNLKALR